MAEDVEVFFPVGVAVAGVVGADGFAFEGVVGPAGSGVPAGAVTGGVDVDGDEEDVGGAFSFLTIEHR